MDSNGKITISTTYFGFPKSSKKMQKRFTICFTVLQQAFYDYLENWKLSYCLTLMIMKIKIFLKKVNLSLKQGKENYKELIIFTVRNKLNAISTITICLSNIFQANFLFMVHVPLELALGRVLSDQKSAPPLSIKTWRS